MSRVNMPKVVIIGLLGNQKEGVHRQLKDIAEVVFIDKDKSSVGWAFPKADLFVCWSRYMQHKHADKAKDCAPPDGFISHHKGLKELVSAVRENIERRFPRKFIPVPVATADAPLPEVDPDMNQQLEEVRDTLKLAIDQQAECHLEINERLLELAAQLKALRKPRFISVAPVGGKPLVHIQTSQISTVKSHVEDLIGKCTLIVMRNGERVLTALTPAEVSKLLEQL